MSHPKAEKAGAATTFCIDGRETADKNPTRYINAARTQEQLIWHYMPSMAVYIACVVHGRVFRVVRCCKYRRGLGSNVLNMPCKPGVCKAMQEGQCEDL